MRVKFDINDENDDVNLDKQVILCRRILHIKICYVFKKTMMIYKILITVLLFI